MKTYKYIIIAFLFKASISFSSEVKTISIETYKSEIDRLNFKITIKYLETLKNPIDSLNLIEFKKSITKHKFNINTFFLLLDKHHFKKTKDNLSIKVDSIKKLVSKKKDFNLFFQKLEDADLKSIDVINGFFIKERRKLAPNFRKKLSNINYNPSNSDDSIFNINLLTVFLLVILILILSFFLIKNFTKNKILISGLEIIKKNQTSKNQTYFENNNVELIKKDKETIELKNKISQLVEGEGKGKVIDDLTVIADKIELNSLSESKTTLFFRSPISDGSFSKDHQSSTVEYANTMFKFELEKNRNIAQFEFFGDKNVLDHAINFSELNIQKVCNYQNSKDDFKTQIITIEPGIAELVGDKWIVKQKAKIKFD